MKESKQIGAVELYAGRETPLFPLGAYRGDGFLVMPRILSHDSFPSTVLFAGWLNTIFFKAIKCL